MADRAGVFTVDVTPGKPVFLAGYTHRKTPSDGVDSPLMLRVLALEDRRGHRVVFVTADLLKFPADMSWRLRRWAERELGLPESALVINLSHTHSAPGLFYQSCYPHWALDVDYVRELEKTIRRGIAAALDDLKPAVIRYGLHQAHFGTSRRRPDPERPGKVRLGLNPPGYYDPDMPMLAVHDPDDNHLRALFYSYACHPTSGSGNLVSADWPGEIARHLEHMLGDNVTPMFAQGGGGSIMPRLKRRDADSRDDWSAVWEPVARQMVEFVSSDAMQEIDLSIDTSHRTFAIPYDTSKIPTQEHLAELADPNEPEVGYYTGPATRQIVRLWACRMLEMLRTDTVPEGFAMHCARIRLAEDVQVIALSGEVTAEVGRMIKQAESTPTIFLGYCSYTDAYIPCSSMLEQEGHEAMQSIYFHERPAPFVPDIDNIILQEVAAT